MGVLLALARAAIHMHMAELNEDDVAKAPVAVWATADALHQIGSDRWNGRYLASAAIARVKAELLERTLCGAMLWRADTSDAGQSIVADIRGAVWLSDDEHLAHLGWFSTEKCPFLYHLHPMRATMVTDRIGAVGWFIGARWKCELGSMPVLWEAAWRSQALQDPEHARELLSICSCSPYAPQDALHILRATLETNGRVNDAIGP